MRLKCLIAACLFALTIPAFANFAIFQAAGSAVSWPNASTTGYQGKSLTAAGSNTISSSGTYNQLRFTGTVSIQASNVTLQYCLITGNSTDNFEIDVKGGLSNVIIQYCQIVGPGTGGTQTGTYGIYIDGDSQVTIQNVDCSAVGTCFEIIGGQVTVGGTVAQGNYCHALGAASETHYECSYYGGGAASDFSLSITGNTFDNSALTQTAAEYQENFFGAVNNVTVTNNLLKGGSYTVYVEGNQGTSAIGPNVTVSNNVMEEGSTGYCDFDPGTASSYVISHSGNVDWITGNPIAACN